MKVVTRGGTSYRLPGSLNEFQRDMYVHLINWKWQHLTREAGRRRQGQCLRRLAAAGLCGGVPDSLPADRETRPSATWRSIRFTCIRTSTTWRARRRRISTCSCRSCSTRRRPTVLRQLKPDFARLATDQLDYGFRVEFKDKPPATPGATPCDRRRGCRYRHRLLQPRRRAVPVAGRAQADREGVYDLRRLQEGERVAARMTAART